MSVTELLIEIAGWAGAVLILLAYFLVTIGRVTARTPAFQWMNLVCAAGFALNGAWHRAIPSATLNVVWMAIAAFALLRIRKAKTA